MTSDDLLKERNELEQRALDWADRWIAANPQYDPKWVLGMIRPISFDRAEVEAVLEACKDSNLPSPPY